MGLFSFLKRKPQPVDFKLRIVPRWSASDGYVCFQYSKNGGRTWKTIHHAEPPMYHTRENHWSWKPLIYRMGGDFKAEKERFSTLEKVLAYEASERKTYEDGDKINTQYWLDSDRKKEQYFKELNGEA